MIVVVQFHHQVEEDLDRWLTGREPNDQDRTGLVRVYVDELIRHLKQTAGEPAGAIRINASEPRLYRWQYTDEVEIGYEVRTRTSRLLRSRSLRIIVREIWLGSVP